MKDIRIGKEVIMLSLFIDYMTAYGKKIPESQIRMKIKSKSNILSYIKANVLCRAVRFQSTKREELPITHLHDMYKLF